MEPPIGEHEILSIVDSVIRKDEKLGEQAGGSGHLGFVTHHIDNINEVRQVQTNKGQGWKITYTYTIVVETEFTYYPDNPPRQIKYKKAIVIDENGGVIEESKKESLGK